MKEPASIESGFLLTGLVFPRQICQEAPVAGDGSEDVFQWGWDWQWADPQHFDVGIVVALEAVPARPYRVEVAVSGRFATIGETRQLSVAEFARDNAPAILFPYARQAIDDLTSRTPAGRLLLPPMNIQAMMADIDVDSAKGARQERPRAVTG